MSTSGFSAPRPAHKLRFDARPGCGTPASKNDWGERLPKERLSPCRRWTEVLPDTVAAAWAFRNPLGVGTKSLRFTPLTQAFVAGSKHEFQLGRPRRQVDIHSLKRQNALFSISESSLEGGLGLPSTWWLPWRLVHQAQPSLAGGRRSKPSLPVQIRRTSRPPPIWRSSLPAASRGRNSPRSPMPTRLSTRTIWPTLCEPPRPTETDAPSWEVPLNVGRRCGSVDLPTRLR